MGLQLYLAKSYPSSSLRDFQVPVKARGCLLSLPGRGKSSGKSDSLDQEVSPSQSFCHTGQHPALLELLEIPQLMDTCVRSGAHDDALDLSAFVAKLGLLHSDLQVCYMALHF